MSIYHNILSTRKFSYLIKRNDIYYFSIKINGRVFRKSLFTDSLDIAKQIVCKVISNSICLGASRPLLKSLIDEQLSYFFNDASSKTTNVINNMTTHEQIKCGKSSSSTNTSLGFSDALDLWVKDKSPNFHRKMVVLG